MPCLYQSKNNTTMQFVVLWGCFLIVSHTVRSSYDTIYPLKSIAVPWSSVSYRNASKIYIVGPQRSGTTFFAAHLARYLNYELWDEMKTGKAKRRSGQLIQVSANTPVTTVLSLKANMVLHRPKHTHLLHKFPPSDQLLIIFMARNCLDVFRSQNRILSDAPFNVGWTCKYGRKTEWMHYNRSNLMQYTDSPYDMICTIKQQVYKRYQLKLLNEKNITTAAVDYHSLSNTKAFLDITKRAHFKSKQIARP